MANFGGDSWFRFYVVLPAPGDEEEFSAMQPVLDADDRPLGVCGEGILFVYTLRGTTLAGVCNTKRKLTHQIICSDNEMVIQPAP